MYQRAINPRKAYSKKVLNLSAYWQQIYVHSWKKKKIQVHCSMLAHNKTDQVSLGEKLIHISKSTLEQHIRTKK